MKPRKLALFANSLILFALLVSPFASPAVAQPQTTFTVTANTDVVDATPGDGVCETVTGNGMCTLRAAIMEANVHVGADIIELPAATYKLTIPGTNEYLSATGDLNVTESLTLTGAGSGDTIIDAEGLNDRVVYIHNTAGVVNISGVKFQNGSVSNGGGAINASAALILTDANLFHNEARDGYGGGIYSTQPVTLTNVVLAENSAGAGGGAITLVESHLYIEDTQFIGNHSDEKGGAVYISIDGHARIVDTNFADNDSGIDGGTIYTLGELLLENSTISGGEATNAGGGIFVAGDADASLKDVSITSNHAGMMGGGIFIGEIGNLTAEHMLFEMNRSDHSGGAIHNAAGTVKLYQSVVRENSADQGGAFSAITGSSTAIRETLIISNTATATGGGISNYGSMKITKTTLSANHAQSGGGIYNQQDIWIENSTLSGNRSTADGGGVYNAGLHAYIYNSTITDNLAGATIQLPSGSGGGVYDLDTYTLIQNTILYGNRHRQLLNLIDDDCYGTLVSGDYNLVGTLNNCTLEAATEHNLIGVDPLLGELADNGGITPTRALQEGSLAIDGGNPEDCLGIDNVLVYTDQRGYFRPFDGDKDGTARCDIGAYELMTYVYMYLPLLVK